MAKKKTTQQFKLTANERRQVIENAFTMRSRFMNTILDPRRDIDEEAGYPKHITSEQYKLLYDREGVARRVVNLMPDESWRVDPVIVDDPKPELTEFEESWIKLQKAKNIYHHLHRIDILSGIGSFGILFLGFSDGKNANEPVFEINEKGEPIGNLNLELLFLRPFDQSIVDIASTEGDMNNPRFGLPTMYNIQFKNQNTQDSAGSAKNQNFTIHWTRVIHIADERESDEIHGTPRMQSVYNRLYDLRKIMGGSGEMFWKGAFPGYAFELDPEASTSATFDREKFRKEIEDYQNGLQRYLALSGVKVKSLAPQVADPTAHADANYKYIAISIKIPLRIFTGSESAQLASAQDVRTWNDRVMHRENKYITPLMLRPLINVFIITGVLPAPKDDDYDVEWPDLNTITDEDKATVALKRTETLAKYIQAGIETIIPVNIFLKLIMNLEADQVETIIEEAQGQMDDDLVDEEEIETEETE